MGKTKTPVQLWVEALRSGEYKQGQGYLRRGDKFCCLGVACDLYMKEGYPLKVRQEGFATAYEGRSAALPWLVQEWLGLTECDGRFESTDMGILLSSSLAACNDEGKSFKDIADIIESRPKGLFKEATDE